MAREADNSECPVCLELIGDANVAISQCKHKYHFECLYGWLKKSNTCPLCRGNLIKDKYDPSQQYQPAEVKIQPAQIINIGNVVYQVEGTGITLKKAVKNNNLQAVKSIVESNRESKEVELEFRNAVKLGYIDIVKYLATKSPVSEKLICNAAEHGHSDIVEFLVSQIPDLTKLDDDALYSAAKKQHFNIVKFLINKNIHIRKDPKYTLFWAAKNGYTDVVKLLKETGMDVHVKDDFALKSATKNNHAEIIELLK